MANFPKNAVAGDRSTRRVRAGVPFALFLALVPILPAATFADDPPRSDEHEALLRMNEQIQELQSKVKELEARLNGVTAIAPHTAIESSVPANAPVEIPSPPVTPATASQEFSEEPTIPGVKLRMFGDVGYEVSDQKGATDSFYIGTLDLFVTGALTDRVSVLGEVLFTPHVDNSFGIDVERLLLQYKQNDTLNFSIGRYHSSIGYYNTAFHQGAWFQTTVDRPFMYRFDDEGGLLPLQEVGLTANGQIPSGHLGLNYVAELSNGSAHLLGADPAENFRDRNNGKSFNLALYARPSWLPGLQTGVSVHHGHITYADNHNYNELISAVHIVYTNSNYELLNEGLLVRHSGTNAAPRGVFHTPGFYTQFSRRFGKYRPYYRYSYVNAGRAEPIYGNPADGPIVGRRNGSSFGLRFDLNDHSAFKIQFDHLAQSGVPDFNQILTQFSFAF